MDGVATGESMAAKLIERRKLAVLFLIVALGLFLRLRGLGDVGFNEDEIQKVVAARSYLNGQFLVNLEHPMLMKSLTAISLAAADIWNRGLGHSHQIPEEVSVRLPNVVFGSLTAIVIFLLGQELFGFGVGLLSALLWSTGTIAIMINRVAKEDTLLVLFTWLAYYLYLRAKNLSGTAEGQARNFYTASGASFGLMLASKYFPHYMGLNALYHYLRGRRYPGRPFAKWDYVLFLGACALVFLWFNPTVVLPNTLEYMVRYAHGSKITHHGYVMTGRLFREDVVGLNGGMPVYFYVLLLTIKTPIPILAGLLAGLVESWRRRREAASSFVLFMFFGWILPFSLIGPKWLRYMLAWMPAVYIIAAIGLVKMYAWLSAAVSQRMSRQWAQALAAACAVVFLVNPVWAAVKSAPYYSLYLNAFGLGRTAYYFPHDEMNDMGLRPAIERISKEAPYGASVEGEAGPVFKYYFHKLGRDDLHYFDLFDNAERLNGPGSSFLVLQEGRKYVENASLIEGIESRQLPVQTVEIEGADAARIYHNQELAGWEGGQ
jgi:4-amino-4-deoxy-L-arabinose transferase-like glycosyltransferase